MLYMYGKNALHALLLVHGKDPNNYPGRMTDIFLADEQSVNRYIGRKIEGVRKDGSKVWTTNIGLVIEHKEPIPTIQINKEGDGWILCPTPEWLYQSWTEKKLVTWVCEPSYKALQTLIA